MNLFFEYEDIERYVVKYINAYTLRYNKHIKNVVVRIYTDMYFSDLKDTVYFRHEGNGVYTILFKRKQATFIDYVKDKLKKEG